MYPDLLEVATAWKWQRHKPLHTVHGVTNLVPNSQDFLNQLFRIECKKQKRLEIGTFTVGRLRVFHGIECVGPTKKSGPSRIFVSFVEFSVKETALQDTELY